MLLCYPHFPTCVIISSVEINVLVDDGLTGCPRINWLQSVAERVLIAQGVSSEAELGLVIASQERVQELNRSYLGKDAPTDVIAFSMLPDTEPHFVLPPDGVLHLGEVIISYPQAVIQAKEHGHSIRKEIAILIIHGVLHLLGCEDGEPELRRQMRAREREILSYVEAELKLR